MVCNEEFALCPQSSGTLVCFFWYLFLQKQEKYAPLSRRKKKYIFRPFLFAKRKGGRKEKLQVSALSQSAPLVLLSRKLESYSEPPMVVFVQSGASVSREPFHCGI